MEQWSENNIILSINEFLTDRFWLYEDCKILYLPEPFFNWLKKALEKLPSEDRMQTKENELKFVTTIGSTFDIILTKGKIRKELFRWKELEENKKLSKM